LQTGHGNQSDENITILDAEVLLMIIFNKFQDDKSSSKDRKSIVEPYEIDMMVKSLQKAIAKLTIYKRNEYCSVRKGGKQQRKQQSLKI
jgi:hypothetical protein